jgi:hypothetical protein
MNLKIVEFTEKIDSLWSIAQLTHAWKINLTSRQYERLFRAAYRIAEVV